MELKEGGLLALLLLPVEAANSWVVVCNDAADEATAVLALSPRGGRSPGFGDSLGPNPMRIRSSGRAAPLEASYGNKGMRCPSNTSTHVASPAVLGLRHIFSNICLIGEGNCRLSGTKSRAEPVVYRIITPRSYVQSI